MKLENVEIRNFTPHTVNLLDSEERQTFTFPSDGNARCTQSVEFVENLCGIRITETAFGEVQDLPDEQEGVMYIVSRLVRQALPDRNDLLVPNEIVRDENGNIAGCLSLARN